MADQNLLQRLEKVTKSCAQALNEELTDGIYERYDTAIQAAAFSAIDTTNHWGAGVNRENRTLWLHDDQRRLLTALTGAAGGLYWATYKVRQHSRPFTP